MKRGKEDYSGGRVLRNLIVQFACPWKWHPLFSSQGNYGQNNQRRIKREKARDRHPGVPGILFSKIEGEAERRSKTDDLACR